MSKKQHTPGVDKPLKAIDRAEGNFEGVPTHTGAKSSGFKGMRTAIAGHTVYGGHKGSKKGHMIGKR